MKIIADGHLQQIIDSIYGPEAFPDRDRLLDDSVSLKDLAAQASGRKLARPVSCPSDVANHLIASYIQDGVPA